VVSWFKTNEETVRSLKEAVDTVQPYLPKIDQIANDVAEIKRRPWGCDHKPKE
jgi:hypothetical protein